MQITQVYPEASYTPSQYCKYFYRCEQSTGDIANAVTTGALAVKNAGFLDATLWASAGYAALGGGSGNYCTIASSTHDVTLNGYSLIVTARVKKATAAFPGAEQYFVASYLPGTNTGGIILSCRTDGSAKMYVNTASGVTVGVTSTAGVLCDGASAHNERSLVWIFPRESGVSAYGAVDGVSNASSAATTVAGLDLSGARSMRLGGNLAGSVIDGYSVAAFAAYQVPVDLGSLNRNQIYDWAYRNPGIPMPDWVFA